LLGLSAVGPSKCTNMEYLLPRMSLFTDPAVSFARYVAKSFDADVVNMGVGGTGLVANTGPKFAAAMGKAKEAELYVAGPTAAVYDHKLCYNFGEAKGNVAKYTSDNVPNADLVVVSIGQTDLSMGAIEPEDVATGSEKYTELLAKVRELRPETPLLCIYPESVNHCSHPHARGVLETMGGAASGFGPTSAYARQKAISGEESVIKAWAMAAAKNLGGEGSKVYVRGVDMQPFFDPKTDYGSFFSLAANGQKKWARGIVPHVQAVMKWDIVTDFKI